MKKMRLRIFLPIIALLLSGCNLMDYVKKFTSKETEIVEIEEDEPENAQTEDKQEEPSFEGYPESINIHQSLPLTIGQSKKINVHFQPSTTAIKDIEWSTDNKSIISIVNGVVTGLKAGKAKISAKTLNNKGETIISECDVVVTDPNIIDKTKLKYTYDDYKKYNAYGDHHFPLAGSPKILVIPVWFANSDLFIDESKKEEIREDIRISFFGSDEETGWKSVKGFYEEESKGTMSLIGTVSDWYVTEEGYESYRTYDTGLGLTRNLVSKATDKYFSNNPSDRRLSYDTNGDGYLDAVLLIYAAPDYVSLGDESAKNLWAYAYYTDLGSNKLTPKPNDFFWGSYDFMYSSGEYALSKTGKTEYGLGDTTHMKVDAHTVIHEMGHVFGASDYYDYSGVEKPAGGFSMQDYDVGGHEAYTVMAYGWANPYIPTSSMTITINDFQSSGDVILLANHDVDSPFDEYLLLELFTPTGLNEFDCKYSYLDRYPQGPTQSGIRLWHVDGRLTQWTGYNFTNNLITNPTIGNVYHAMSNTSYVEDSDNSYISALGKDYADYNLLDLIRCDGNRDILNEGSLFTLGSSFKVSDYDDQFVKNMRLNDGSLLGWKFSVDAIDETSASITVTKI